MGGCLPDQPGFHGRDHRIFGSLKNARLIRDNSFFIGVHSELDEKIFLTSVRRLIAYSQLSWKNKDYGKNMCFRVRIRWSNSFRARSKNGYEVHGIEILEHTRNSIKFGKAPFHEPGINELLKTYLINNYLYMKKYLMILNFRFL